MFSFIADTHTHIHSQQMLHRATAAAEATATFIDCVQIKCNFPFFPFLLSNVLRFSLVMVFVIIIG